jgi:8-oxo-dGTP pyrophosphatase MutT (NUDIX family)/ribosomal protein S18 acetylase RimI-like enzyme
MQRRTRASAIVIRGRNLLGFWAEDPTSHARNFFLPGGELERDEDAAATAVRETLEETGYTVAPLSEFAVNERYDFLWDGKWYDCQTTFLPASVADDVAVKPVVDADYHRGVAWIDVADIDKAFRYHPAIHNVVRRLAGTLLMTDGEILYFANRVVPIDATCEVFADSGLRRPVQDRARIAQMLKNASLTISAWENDKLVGIARSLTDFCYATYLSDLAVARSRQKSGVGRKLVELTKQVIGPNSNLVLIAAPEAIKFYEKIGMPRLERGFWQQRES